MIRTYFYTVAIVFCGLLLPGVFIYLLDVFPTGTVILLFLVSFGLVLADILSGKEWV